MPPVGGKHRIRLTHASFRPRQARRQSPYPAYVDLEIPSASECLVKNYAGPYFLNNPTVTESPITQVTLENGMTILVQSMPWLRSTAFSISLRAGIKSEADDRNGLAALTCEMVQRGAGKYSSRELAAIQDNLGMDRNSGVTLSLIHI